MESESVFHNGQQEDPIRNAIRNKNIVRDGVILTEEDIDNDGINNMRFLAILGLCESIINDLKVIQPILQKISIFIDNDYNKQNKAIIRAQIRSRHSGSKFNKQNRGRI